MPIQYLAEQSANYMSQDIRLQRIYDYISQAKTLNAQYTTLHNRQKDLQFAQQILTIHQENRKTNAKAYVNVAYWDFHKQKKYIQEYNQIQTWLTDLHHWSLRGYKLIISMRKDVTNQELIYHIQDTSHSFSYTLTESQYLRLLSQNDISMTYAGTSSLEDAAKGEKPLGDLFKLNVGATQNILSQIDEWSQQKGKGLIPKANLKQDVLYQYLMQDKGVIKTDRGDTSHSRIYELHSQLSAAYEWSRNPDGSIQGPEDIKKKGKSKFFFTKTRENAVAGFIQKYIQANMHKDNIAFYKTGDAIQDNKTLIENKVGKAVISIQTIKNAIQEIASLSTTSKEKLRKGLIQLFTYSGGDSFSRKIQDGAKNFAIKSINSIFKRA